jgi:hypothetical protein
MTIPRFAVIAIACLLFVDVKFDNGRLTDSLEDQAARVGYWLSSEFDDLSHRIARFHWSQRVASVASWPVSQSSDWIAATTADPPTEEHEANDWCGFGAYPPATSCSVLHDFARGRFVRAPF